MLHVFSQPPNHHHIDVSLFATLQYVIVSTILFRTIYGQKSSPKITIPPSFLENYTLSTVAGIRGLHFSPQALAPYPGRDIPCSNFGSKGVEILVSSSPNPSYSQRSLAKRAYVSCQRPNSPEIDFCGCSQPPQSHGSRSLRSR